MKLKQIVLVLTSALVLVGCGSTHRSDSDSGIEYDATPPSADSSGMSDANVPGPPPGAGGVCEPNPMDRRCQACTRADCCDLLTACVADENCACVQDCIAAGGNPRTCIMETCEGAGELAMQMRNDCRRGICADECGGGGMGGGGMGGGGMGGGGMGGGGMGGDRDGGMRGDRDGGMRGDRDGGMGGGGMGGGRD